MSYTPHLLASEPAIRPRKRPGRRVASLLLAVVSIHPPGLCRVRTSGTTVVFTPVIPPGPPG